jgi:hypothetical protein
MTGAAYPFKTLDQAKAVREAAERSLLWDDNTYRLVGDLMPSVARKAGHQVEDWIVSVETQRRDWETPPDAAYRLAQWVTLWAETYASVPTQRAIQRTTEAKPYPHKRNHW